MPVWTRPRPAPAPARRTLAKIGTFLCERTWLLLPLSFCLLLDFFFARSIVPNSDTIQAYNELASIADGNLLLRHWVLASDNFYLTDLPFFIVFRYLIGDRPELTFIVPFFIFFLFLTACLLLVHDDTRSASENRIGLYSILFLLGLPFSALLEMFAAGAHTATIMFCLYALLISRPILRGRSISRARLLLFSGLVLAAAAGDPFADAFFIGPFLVFLFLRVCTRRSFRRDEAVLALCLLAGLTGGVVFVRIVSGLGGFTTQSNFTTGFISSAGELRSNIIAIRGAAEILFSARAILLIEVPAHRFMAFTRLLTCILVVILCFRVLWRMPRAPRDGVAHCLVLCSLCLLTLDALSQTFASVISSGLAFPGSAVRYVRPACVFGSIAGAIEIQSLYAAARQPALRRLGPAIGLAFISFFVVGAVQAAIAVAPLPSGFARAPQRELAGWLRDHRFTYGLGDYWTTQMVRAITRDKVLMDPIVPSGDKLVPFRWISDGSRFDRHQPPQFITYRTSDGFGVTAAAVTATFGTAQKIYRLDPYVIVQLAAPGIRPPRTEPHHRVP